MRDEMRGIFTDREIELIELAAEAAAHKVQAEAMSGQPDYYRIVEKLLFNYKRLEALVNNEDDYLQINLKGKSKDIVLKKPSGSIYKNKTEIADDMQDERIKQYEKTASRFREVERVVALFEDRKEFIVIRMYYFNEDAVGNPRDKNAKQYTWDEIAFELSEFEILKDEKTARRWRTNLINDIAVCMFGTAGAISSGTFKTKSNSF